MRGLTAITTARLGRCYHLDFSMYSHKVLRYDRN